MFFIQLGRLRIWLFMGHFFDTITRAPKKQIEIEKAARHLNGFQFSDWLVLNFRASDLSGLKYILAR